jgi:hypothetical protein
MNDILQLTGEIGDVMLPFLHLRTFLQTDWSYITPQKWHRLVLDQVYKMEDVSLDPDAAYDLMDKQNNKCKKCNSDLNLFDEDHLPCIIKETKSYNFLRMHTTEIMYEWICGTCCTNEQFLDNTIAHLVHLEEKGDETYKPYRYNNCI